jgi:hypothetical protein
MLKELTTQHGLNQKTVAKWRKHAFVNDAPMDQNVMRSAVLTAREAMAAAFCKQTFKRYPTRPYTIRSHMRAGSTSGNASD